MEIWRTVPGFGNHYEASSLGRIKSKERKIEKWHHSGKVITQTYKERVLSNRNISIDGYIKVGLGVEGKKISTSVHRLVLLAFYGEPPDNHFALHINGIPNDNRLENLRWGTPLENAADREAHGRSAIGERHSRAILTDEIVRLIRSSTTNGAELGRLYGVSRTTISYVRNRKIWRHI